MMRKLLIAAATLAALTMPASADENLDTAKGLMRLALYSQHCEKLPGIDSILKAADLPANSIASASEIMKEEFTTYSIIKWCAIYKPLVDRVKIY
jgi:hypothetical protein